MNSRKTEFESQFDKTVVLDDSKKQTLESPSESRNRSVFVATKLCRSEEASTGQYKCTISFLPESCLSRHHVSQRSHKEKYLKRLKHQKVAR